MNNGLREDRSATLFSKEKEKRKKRNLAENEDTDLYCFSGWFIESPPSLI